MHVRALSFDLFDTLIDLHLDGLPVYTYAGRELRGTQPELFRALPARAGIEFERFRAALAGVDLELREGLARQGRELPTLDRFRALLERLEVDEAGLAERLTQVHMDALGRCARTPAHHAALLRRLAERFPIALCSNFSHAPTARRLLREADLDGALSHVLISEEVGFRKPRAEMFRAVERALGLAPAEILHIGDRLDADVAGAAAVGMRTGWLKRRASMSGGTRAPERAFEPDLLLDDLAQLADHLAV